jgi:RDD family
VTDGVYHPWRRFFARYVDVSGGGVLAIFVLAFALSIVSPRESDTFAKALENQIVAGLVLFTLWTPIEALLLALWGTTPGKLLFGISVTGPGGRLLTLGEAFHRSIRVAVQGAAIGLPLVALFAQVFAYQRLTRTGTTRWDTATGAVVTHQPLGRARLAVCTITVIAVGAMLVTLIALSR